MGGSLQVASEPDGTIGHSAFIYERVVALFTSLRICARIIFTGILFLLLYGDSHGGEGVHNSYTCTHKLGLRIYEL
jgi:hypothetical protein